ncbi:EamA-like transporter family protein [Marinomonas gallaica]|uniref:EamA-like transporter family protein n=1 Tax=Marinomonas gallaica TaxID=1806667 RepID=A0A1C3JLN5_9GAMM|nr:DMT family transporter [Marinomonas gallaica]SBT16071.1 EamA-like transporter family protein [Marinomonas gallaica]SBT21119.1 EamA-like transporter family protein [Marinomonas gallaica]
MPFAELSGLVAALCWTISSLMAPRLIESMGTFRFNTCRITLAAILLCSISLWRFVSWDTLGDYLPLLILSGVIGIFIGDNCLFSAVNRIGPRRAGILFAMNAPFSILLAWLFLDETLSIVELLCCGVVLIGVMIAILFGKRGQTHAWESTKGSLGLAVSIALIAALCQASGALLAKPALLAGVDPVVASAARVGASALCLLITYRLYFSKRMPQGNTPLQQFPLNLWLRLAVVATIGMVIGMSVLVWGVANADVGLVTTLSATVPVLILPGLWLTTKQRPAPGAWLGALLVVSGAMGIILH